MDGVLELVIREFIHETLPKVRIDQEHCQKNQNIGRANSHGQTLEKMGNGKDVKGMF
jgi:hypothetical protein